MSTYSRLAAMAQPRTTDSLIESLLILEGNRATLKAALDYEMLRVHNEISCSIIEVLMERHPALSAAFDAWWDDLDAPEQTMGSFVIEFLQGVTA